MQKGGGPCAGQARLDGALVNADRHSQLGIAHVFQLTQQQDLALLGRQRCQSALQQAQALPVGTLLLR